MIPPQVVPILHIVGAVFAFINFILGAILIDHFSVVPSAIAFVVFSCIWSFLVITYLALAPVFRPQWFRSTTSLGALLVTVIFWLSAAIAEAHDLGTFVCGLSRSCQAAQASIAFSFFLLAVFAVVTIIEGLEWKKRWRVSLYKLASKV